MQALQANLEGGNLDPKESEKARAILAKEFPDGIEECGTDALRCALISYTCQVTYPLQKELSTKSSVPPVCYGCG